LSSLACAASAVSAPTEPTEATPILAVAINSDVVEPSRVIWCEVSALESLNVRGGPAVSWAVLYQLSNGDRVRVTDWFHGWAMVKPAEWVNGDYLRCQ